MATEDATRGRGPAERGVEAAKRPLPGRDACETILAKMLLIRRFEERAGEMYAKAKIGGFPPVHRRGGHDRRRHPGAARQRLPDVDLP